MVLVLGNNALWWVVGGADLGMEVWLRLFAR